MIRQNAYSKLYQRFLNQYFEEVFSDQEKIIQALSADRMELKRQYSKTETSSRPGLEKLLKENKLILRNLLSAQAKLEKCKDELMVFFSQKEILEEDFQPILENISQSLIEFSNLVKDASIANQIVKHFSKIEKNLYDLYQYKQKLTERLSQKEYPTFESTLLGKSAPIMTPAVDEQVGGEEPKIEAMLIDSAPVSRSYKEQEAIKNLSEKIRKNPAFSISPNEFNDFLEYATKVSLAFRQGLSSFATSKSDFMLRIAKLTGIAQKIPTKNEAMMEMIVDFKQIIDLLRNYLFITDKRIKLNREDEIVYKSDGRVIASSGFNMPKCEPITQEEHEETPAYITQYNLLAEFINKQSYLPDNCNLVKIQAPLVNCTKLLMELTPASKMQLKEQVEKLLTKIEAGIADLKLPEMKQQISKLFVEFRERAREIFQTRAKREFNAVDKENISLERPSSVKRRKVNGPEKPSSKIMNFNLN